MPLKTGTSEKVVSENISELHSGKTYARTKSKFGKKKADRQAVAIAMSKMRDSMPMGRSAPRGTSLMREMVR